jgi:outer membrane protein TolC
MRLKSIYMMIVLSLLILSKLDAQENLDSLLVIAAKNNPSLKAKYNKYMADLQKVPQVGTLPDPDITFGYFIKPMELLGGQQRAQIQIMQMFPWFGTLKASKDEASAMALASYEQFRQEKEEIFYNVKINYYELFLNREQMQVYDTTLVLLKSIEQLILSKLKSGNTNGAGQGNKGNSTGINNSQENNAMGMNSNNQQLNQKANNSMSNQSMSGSGSTYSDLLRLQIEIKELEDNIASLKNREQIFIIQINTLLNRKTAEQISLTDSLDVPLFDFQNPNLFDSIKANNPMIKMNQADIQAYQKRQLMSKKMAYPMVGLGLNYMVINKSEMNTSEMNGKDMMMPMLSLKLPIYRKKYKASVKEAELMENSSNEQLVSAENMLYMEFSDYRYSLVDAVRKLSLYHDIISLTKQSLDLSLVQYTSSGSDFEAFIRLYRQLMDYRLYVSKLHVDRLSAIAGIQKLLSDN